MIKSYSDQFIKISNFLKNYQEIFNIEFLKKYPSAYPKEITLWIEELKKWDFNKLAVFETSPDHKMIEDESFREFISTIQDLTKLSSLDIQETKLPSELLKKLNPKKKHEIQVIKTISDEDQETETIIDIGGGAGHLSCALLQNTQKKSICIDYDSPIQLSGKKKINKWLPHLNDKVSFLTMKFDKNSEIEEKFDPSKSTLIGLHSCGDLSTSIINYSITNNIGSIISFGCCYHKLNDSYNLSKLAKENGISLSTNALHLANRSSAKVNEEDIKRRFTVRRYRYSLHYYLNDNFNLPFIGIGNTSKIDYENTFSTYARKYHTGNELGSVSEEKLESYFESEDVQEKVINNVLADMIRLNFGRVIEVYLLLDRAILLEEAGRKVELQECFNRELSPRNIMLRSTLSDKPHK